MQLYRTELTEAWRRYEYATANFADAFGHLATGDVHRFRASARMFELCVFPAFRTGGPNTKPSGKLLLQLRSCLTVRRFNDMRTWDFVFPSDFLPRANKERTAQTSAENEAAREHVFTMLVTLLVALNTHPRLTVPVPLSPLVQEFAQTIFARTKDAKPTIAWLETLALRAYPTVSFFVTPLISFCTHTGSTADCFFQDLGLLHRWFREGWSDDLRMIKGWDRFTLARNLVLDIFTEEDPSRLHSAIAKTARIGYDLKRTLAELDKIALQNQRYQLEIKDLRARKDAPAPNDMDQKLQRAHLEAKLISAEEAKKRMEADINRLTDTNLQLNKDLTAAHLEVTINY